MACVWGTNDGRDRKEKQMRMKLPRTSEILKTLRKGSGFTQKELGDKIGLHSQYLSNAERHACFYPKTSLKKLKKVLKISPRSQELLEDALRADAEDLILKEYQELLR